MYEFRIGRNYEVSETGAATIDIQGSSYMVIYGKTIGGWYFAIPNWGKGGELAHPKDTFWNMESIMRVFADQGWEDTAEFAATLAKAIQTDYEMRPKKQKKPLHM